MSGHPVLLLDCGNSFVKCQFVHVPGQSAESGQAVFEHLNACAIGRIENRQAGVDQLLGLWEELAMGRAFAGVECSWISVGPQSVQQAVRTAFHRLTGRDAPDPWQPCAGLTLQHLAVSQFENRYAMAGQLGADRWVSALGLACQGWIAPGETHLVVSAGTATTVDLIRAEEGRKVVFLGGWILPGMGLMQEALRVKTRDLDGLMGSKSQARPAADAGIPTDSRSAISQGIGLAQTGFIGQIARQHQVTKLWLHGGDAAAWRVSLSGLSQDAGIVLTVHDQPHLAFAGLLALHCYRASA